VQADRSYFHRFDISLTEFDEEYEFPAILVTQLFIGSDGGELLLSVGATDETFPVAYSVPFTFPVRADSVTIYCYNEVLPATPTSRFLA
jgi:hypothetical protein